MKELRDGWPSAIAAIETLEAQNHILVTRNRKDNTPRLIYPSSPALSNPIDADFMNMWHKIRIPATSDELRADLERAGLTPTSQVKEAVQVGRRDKKKRAMRKGGKTTNTHMEKVLKDYSGTRR